jgi:hypothetical protein
MQRPGAMVTDPNGDPGIVEDLADIIMVDTVDHEGTAPERSRDVRLHGPVVTRTQGRFVRPGEQPR